MELKMKHLEMVQNVITRMANNSFLLKGWSLTLVSALLALSVSNSAKRKFMLIALLVTLVFWVLDAFFLRQERLYRHLYDHVRTLPPEYIDFSMNTQPFVQEENTASWRVMVSKTLTIFHGCICLAIVLSMFILQ